MSQQTQEKNDFDLIHIFRIIAKRKKFVLLFTTIVVAIGAICCLITDKKYTSSSLFIVKNPILFDRNFVFRNSLYEHKEFFAVPNDVDQVEAIAKSEDLLRHITSKFDLANYYGISNPFLLRMKVKGNFSFSRQDTKNIEVYFTDKDPKLAEEVTREIRNYLENKFLNYFLEANKQVTTALKIELGDINLKIDSLSTEIQMIRETNGLQNQLLPTRGTTIQNNSNISGNQVAALEKLQSVVTLKDQLTKDQAEYYSLINEFEMIGKGNMNIFYIVHDALLPDESSHPKTILILIGCLIGGLFFSSVIVVSGAFYREKER